MNLKKSGRILWIVAAVAMLAMVLQGCGGDDGVSPSTHDDLQSDYNALKADYDALVEMVGAMGDDANMEGSLYAQINHYMEAASAATNQANSLMMQIGSEDEPANMDGSLYAQINYYMEAANTATNNASDLMEQIGGMDDPANMEGSLYAQINYYMEAASDLMEQIGGMDDPANMEGSLYAQINHYMEAASDLMEQIGSEDAPANMEGSLYAQINYHMEAANTAAGEASDLMEQIGDMDDPANMEGSLYAQINYHMEQAEDLRGEIGTPDDEANDSEDATLHAQLNAARDHIAALEGGTAPELLDPIKTAASDAADAASDAATAARTAANAAMTAAMNRATMQTGDANSAADAMDAGAHADTAEAEAGKAATASQMAQDAMDTATATPQRMAAEAARDAAMDARGMAVDAQGEAEADAMVELKIDGTMNSVGDISVDADAPNIVVTTGTGATAKTVNTGFQADLQQEAAGAVAGVDFVAAAAPAEDTAYVQAVAARDIDIGKTVDSADDMARLAIVTQYAGSRTVKVYADNAGAANEVTTRAGMMSVIDGTDGTRNTDDDTYVALRSEGTYYPVDNTGGDANALEADDAVTADAEGQAVFSFLDVGPNNAVGGGDDVKVYVVLETTSTTGSTTTYTYDVIDVDVEASDATTDGTAEEVQVTANIPEGTDYDHINFGVWAALDEDGANPSAHGIGFVQNIVSDGSMTPVMPNFGDATFNGNWVATVQMADPDGNGDISIQDGTAMMTADFEDNDVMVTLTGLATLEGDISENTFSGTEATVGTNTYGLTADEDFTGSFEGAFFGVGAAEAGGVFSFGSEDMEAGAFAGAFGGARD